jgi:hypothetical protein
MPVIKREAAAHGDILGADVTVNGVVLFEAGTMLTTPRLDILKTLGVGSITIAGRSGEKPVSLNTIYKNLDSRFSFVDALPLMSGIKKHVREVIAQLEEIK